MPGGSASPLDDALDAAMRAVIEDRFWQPIEAAASLEALTRDDVLSAPGVVHPALFADHGRAHVRDIARMYVEVAATADGIVLPARPPERRRFLVTTGVLLTYLHDIGMVDPTVEGRRIHPAFAAHVAFGPGVDDLVDALQYPPGALAERLTAVDADEPFGVPTATVVREVLSLALAHSKTTVPPQLLGDPAALRARVQELVFTSLDRLREGERCRPGQADPGAPATARYEHPWSDSFRWLVSEHPGHRALADDVVDAVRLLRAADSLRRRGTLLRTSAGFEIFIDAGSGEAVFALRDADAESLHLLRVPDRRASGEANMRSAVLTPDGHVRIAFQAGAYRNSEVRRRVADHTADAIADVEADVIPSFRFVRERVGLPAPLRHADEMLVQLERPADHPPFAAEVAEALLRRAPHLEGRVVVVADLEGASDLERDRYHHGEPVPAASALADSIVEEMDRRGANTAGIDRDEAFDDVRIVRLTVGEPLMEVGSPPAFVYVPLAEGLRVHPAGGFRSQRAAAWVPLGVTGVVRRAARNADVVAEDDVPVLMIPGELYVRAWFRPFGPEELGSALRSRGGEGC